MSLSDYFDMVNDSDSGVVIPNSLHPVSVQEQNDVNKNRCTKGYSEVGIGWVEYFKEYYGGKRKKRL